MNSSKNVIVYDRDQHGIEQVEEMVSQGKIILCPDCAYPLIVALDLESANRLRVHPGIFCPNDYKHICILISLKSVRDDFWKIFDDEGKVK